MSFATWIAFVAASSVMLMIPGPTVFLVVSYALSQGKRVALAMAAGVALGDLTAMTLSLAGLGAIIAASATLFTILKWAGAAYLVYLGIRLWRSGAEAAADAGRPETEASPGSLGRIFGHAFLVTVLNPKSIAFFVAFVPQFLDPHAALLPQLAILEATFVALSATNASAYALGASRLRSSLRRPRVLLWLHRIGAGSLIGMAGVAATRS